MLDLRYPLPEEMGPSWNVAPTQAVPVCRLDETGQRELSVMRWGFTPRRAGPGSPRPINARSETAASSPMFRSAFRNRRCVVPVSGFYEWRRTPSGKTPWYIRPKGDEIFRLAGLWEAPAEDADAPPTFAILTTGPNAIVAPIHDRMPVILRPEDVGPWLDGSDAGPGLLGPFSAERMEAFAVSPRVNNVRHNDASLCRPAESAGGLFGP